MPIGTTAAIIGSAAIGAIGSAKAAKKNKQAINTSTDAQLQSNREAIAAQERATQQGLQFQQNALDQTMGFQRDAYNNSGQLQTDVYNQNVGRLDPYNIRGNMAGNQVNAMLGLGTAQYTPSAPVTFNPLQAPATPPPASTLPPANALLPNGIPAYARGTRNHPGGPALVGEQGPEVVNLPQGSQVIPNALSGSQQRRADRQAARATRRLGTQNQPNTPVGQPVNNPAGNAQTNALNTFYETPLYQFPLAEGLDAINANYAARGMLESGAAQKSLLNYGAGVAGGALGDYFGLLNNQQGMGLSAAQSQAGVGQNYAGNIAGLNANYANSLSGANSAFANNATQLYGNLGNAYGQGAYNTGNALSGQALGLANNSNSMWSGIGNSLMGAAGQLAYRPYA